MCSSCVALRLHACSMPASRRKRAEKRPEAKEAISFRRTAGDSRTCSTLRQATMIRIVAFRRVSLVPGEPSSTHGSSSSVRTKAIPEQISSAEADKNTAEADEVCNTACHCHLAFRRFTIQFSFKQHRPSAELKPCASLECTAFNPRCPRASQRATS